MDGRTGMHRTHRNHGCYAIFYQKFRRKTVNFQLDINTVVTKCCISRKNSTFPDVAAGVVDSCYYKNNLISTELYIKMRTSVEK